MIAHVRCDDDPIDTITHFILVPKSRHTTNFIYRKPINHHLFVYRQKKDRQCEKKKLPHRTANSHTCAKFQKEK